MNAASLCLMSSEQVNSQCDVNTHIHTHTHTHTHVYVSMVYEHDVCAAGLGWTGSLTTGGPVSPLCVRCRTLLSGHSVICSPEPEPPLGFYRPRKAANVPPRSPAAAAQQHTKKKKTSLLKFIETSTSGAPHDVITARPRCSLTRERLLRFCASETTVPRVHRGRQTVNMHGA